MSLRLAVLGSGSGISGIEQVEDGHGPRHELLAEDAEVIDGAADDVWVICMRALAAWSTLISDAASRRTGLPPGRGRRGTGTPTRWFLWW